MKKTIILLCTLFATTTFAQRGGGLSSKYNTLSGGVSLGNIYVDSDLKSFGETNNYIKFGFGAFVTKQFNSVFGLQAEVLYGQIGGERVVLNRQVDEGRLISTNLSGLIYLTNIGVTGNKSHDFNLYLKFGFGLINFESTTTNFSGNNPQIQPSTVELEIPLGIGARYRFNERFDFEAAVTMHSVFGDGFDGANSTASESDKFFYSSLGVVYKFGKKSKSIEWTNPLDDMHSDIKKVRADFDGITNDTDGDGVADLMDKEPDTKEGTVVDGSGRALDVDADGVPDYQDVDPYTPRGVAVDNTGREKDTDKDGVPDSKDLEPETTVGSLVNFEGRTIKLNSGGGAPVESYLPSIFFRISSASVDFSNFQRLSTVAMIMNANPNLKLRVIGFTDATGPEEFNLNLGKSRAGSVVRHLIDVYGIDESRFIVETRGEEDQFAKGVNSLNRRVDFKVFK